MNLRKITQILLYALFAVSAVTCIYFFVVGIPEVTPPAEVDSTTVTEGALNSNSLNLYLNWGFVLLCLTAVITIVVSLIAFALKFVHTPKKAMISLLGIISLLLVFLVAWIVSDIHLLDIKSPDNTESWMAASGTLLNGVYGLTAIAILAAIGSGIRKMII